MGYLVITEHHCLSQQNSLSVDKNWAAERGC